MSPGQFEELIEVARTIATRLLVVSCMLSSILALLAWRL